MSDEPPPPDPWYRRYWGYYNRPYTGCGCLYTVAIFLIIWLLLALIFPPLAIWEPVTGLLMLVGSPGPILV